MPNLIVIPSGYMGSGSSAVTDLVSELDGFERNHGSFEYLFMHCPDGVFDLEDKLLRGNNSLRSDEAVHRFLRYMKKLHGPGYWFSGYGEKISPDFLRYCEEFIADLRPTVMDDVYWYHQDDLEAPSKRLAYRARRAAAKLLGGRLPDGKPVRPLTYYGLTMAYPSPEEFYAAARRFLAKIYDALGIREHHLVLDQFLLPHNVFRLNDYFDENVRVFIVDRDPRDVFLLNKYFWLPSGCPVPFPTDAEAFCAAYEGIRRCERPSDDPRVLRLHFEDLVYRYDETCGKIFSHLGADGARHGARRGTIFRPERSANNTRLFDKDPDFAREAALIAERLGPYLYDFPPSDGETWREALVF